MLKKWILAMVLISPCAMAGVAQEQLLRFTQEVKSASGQFTQLRQGGVLEQGVFSFKRPGRFLWYVKTPFEQVSSSDGKNIYQYDPDLQQLTIRPVQLGSDQSPARVLFGHDAIDQKRFIFQELPSQEGLDWVRATPKIEDQGVRYVDMGFQKGQLSRLRLKDSFNQIVEVTLSQMNVNIVIPDTSFQIQAPQGVDILRLSE